MFASFCLLVQLLLFLLFAGVVLLLSSIVVVIIASSDFFFVTFDHLSIPNFGETGKEIDVLMVNECC